MRSSTLKGSCLCGGIRYEINGPLGAVVNCHCSMCRKATGAAFRTRASVPARSFRWTHGEELLTRYESSPGNVRTFCRVCGSTLASFFPDAPEEIGLPLGTMDDDPGVRPEATWMRGSSFYSPAPRLSSPPPGSSFTEGIFMMSLRAVFHAFCTIQESERSCRAASSPISFSISSGK
jgi:hypothetical protein